VQTRDNATTTGSVTVIFDGDCGFCTSCVNYLVQRSSAPIRAVAWQQTNLASFGLTRQQAAAQVYAVIAGRAYGGHRAIASILMAQHGLLPRAAGWAITAPPGSWLAALGYRLVARLRHLLPGSTPACAVSGSRDQDF
jgi:predicted DCC family thiol-disulfide oxidoreductase YuxK